MHAMAELYDGCHIFKILDPVEPLNKGCSGGPVFTEDHQLIGIVQGHFHDKGQTLWIKCLRIDFAATGWLRQEMGGFEKYRLENSVSVSCNDQTVNA
jgi:hypothetical protein